MALVLALRSRRRERALTEAEAYARCHGSRGRDVSPYRVPVSPESAMRAARALLPVPDPPRPERF